MAHALPSWSSADKPVPAATRDPCAVSDDPANSSSGNHRNPDPPIPAASPPTCCRSAPCARQVLRGRGKEASRTGCAPTGLRSLVRQVLRGRGEERRAQGALLRGFGALCDRSCVGVAKRIAHMVRSYGVSEPCATGLAWAWRRASRTGCAPTGLRSLVRELQLLINAEISAVRSRINAVSPRDSTLRRSNGSVLELRRLKRHAPKSALMPSVWSSAGDWPA